MEQKWPAGVQGRQQAKHQQSYISCFVAYPTIPNSNQQHQPTHDNTIPCIAVWQIQSNLRRKKLHRRNQGSIFLGGSFSNRDNVRAPNQFQPFYFTLVFAVAGFMQHPNTYINLSTQINISNFISLYLCAEVNLEVVL